MMRFFAGQCAVSAMTLLLLVTANLGGCPGPRPPAERPAARVNPVEGLAAQLKDSDWQKRVDAARKLGATRHADAVAPLAGAVGDSDVRVRLAVVQACAVHRSPKLIPALKKGVVDKERKIRIHAVRALARISTREAAEAMIEVLDGASMWLRPEVADGLAGMPAKVLSDLEVGIQILVAELDPARKPRLRRLAKALAAIGEPAMRILVLAVYKPAGLLAKKHVSSDTKCLRGPCRALVSMGPKGFATLLRMGQDGIRDINAWNLYHVVLPTVAGKIGKSALPLVLGTLGKPGSRGSLAESVIAKMGPGALPPLVKILRKRGQSAKMRAQAVRLIGKIRDKRATSVLLAALRDPARAVQAAAVKALARRPTEETFAALAARIKSGSKTVRLAIVRGARAASGKVATRLLLLALGQSELDVRLRAVQALGKRKDKQAVLVLLAVLKKKPRGKLHLAAVKALGRIGDPRALSVLARLARRGKEKLRLAAIRALGTLGTKRAKKLLGRLKKSRNKAIAKAAADALSAPSVGKFGFKPTGIPACDKYLKFFSCYVKQMSASMRAPTIAAFRKSIQAWRKMAASPARSSVAKGCQMALGAFQKAFRANPKYKACLNP